MPFEVGWGTPWGPGTNDPVQAYYSVCDFMYAIQECKQILDDARLAKFPDSAQGWANVFVDSATLSGDESEIHVVCKDSEGLSPEWEVDRWVNYSDPIGDPEGYIPANYDAWINHLAEPRMRLRARVVSNTEDTLVLQNTNPSWDFNWTLSELEGLPLELVKQAGQTRLERWLIGPNDWEYEFGKIGPDSTAEEVILHDFFETAVSLAPGRFMTVDAEDPGEPTGYEFISRFSGKWRRVGITASPGGNTLSIDDAYGNPDIGAGWYIIKTGGVWYEDAATVLGKLQNGTLHRDYTVVPSLAWRWYGGLGNAYLSHLPEKEAGNADPQALGSFGHVARPTYPRIIDEFDTTVNEPILDRDYHIAYDDEFNTPRDHFISEELYTTLRSWVEWLEGNCNLFAEKRATWAGFKGLIFPNFTTATLYRYLNVNWCEAEITSVDGSGVATISGMILALPQSPWPVYWTMRDSNGIDGEVLQFDHGPFNGVSDRRGYVTTTTITAGGHPTFAFSAGDVGNKVTISLGLYRYEPLEFRWMFDVEYWLPDERFNEMSEGFDVIDPPEEPEDIDEDPAGPGSFVTRAKSTKRKTHDELGRVIESDEDFIVGKLYRYAGENFGDPSTSDQGLPPPNLTPYHDNTWTAPVAPWLPKMSLGGTATRGGAGWVEIEGMDWWQGRGHNYLIEGTATGGGANTLVDSGKSNSAFFRFPERELLKRGILEQKDPDSGEIVAYRPITNHTVGGGNVPTLTLRTGSGPAIDEGTPYQIRIPKYERNHWQGRPVKLTSPEGVEQITAVLYSDDKRLWFDTSIIAGEGWSVQIQDPRIGWTFKRTGTGITGWEHPTGTDPRISANFPDDSKMVAPIIPPHLNHTYGRPMNGDQVTLSLYDFIYRAVNALDELISGHAWDDKDEENFRLVNDQFASWNTEGTPAISYGTATDNFAGGHNYFWANVGTHFWHDETDPESFVTTNIKVTGGDAPPQAFVEFGVAGGAGWPESGSLFGARGAAYHYGKITNGSTYMPSAIDFYAYGTRDSANNDEVNDTLPGGGFFKGLFDAMGTGLQFREWVKWHTLAASVGAERITAEPLGDLTAPPVPDAGPNPDQEGGAWSYVNGFYAFAINTVHRFQKKFHG